MNKKYKTIYADPPWPEYGGGKIKRGANKHYPLLTINQIKAMDRFVKELRHPDGCHLYLWVTNNFLPSGLEVMSAWGFKYKTIITWVKDRFGLGQYFRGQTEQLLFGIYKVLPYKVKNGKRQQGTTVIHAQRRKHSQKPDEAYELIEKVSHAPRIELFARARREGWDAWGNELLLKLKSICMAKNRR